MTTFSSLGFSYEAEDKDFEYPPQILEEPFSDFFDQYLTQTLSDIGDHGYEASDAEFSDFFTDGDTTSSVSYATDSTSSAPIPHKHNTLQDRSRQENASSLSRTAFVPQNYHSRGRRERLLPAVSGLELLLDIEGRANKRPDCPNPPHSAPATITSLPLRRKPRFNKSTSKDVHDRDRRVVKSSIHPYKDQPDMIQALYNHRIESPQPKEWTQGFEQPSLQTTVNQFPLSPPTTDMLPYYDEAPDDLRIPRHMTLREQFFQEEKTREQERSHMPNHLDSSANTTFERLDPESQRPTTQKQDATVEGFHEYLQSLQLEPAGGQRLPYHSSSWEPSNPSNPSNPSIPSIPSSSDMTYTQSAGQPVSNWNHGLPEMTNNYYTHHHASKSAPSFPSPLSAEPSLEYLTATTDENGTFTDQDPSNDYMVSPGDPFTVNPEPHQYPPPPPPPIPNSFLMPAQDTLHSPPRRISSPAVRIPISHSRRRSKSAQRRKSAGNLKSSKSEVSMGFVNFTPSDSKRILTGVAPSGSSKTKARREQEANEKKRKLSLAVLRAVEEAGGDPGPLRKEGLLI